MTGNTMCTADMSKCGISKKAGFWGLQTAGKKSLSGAWGIASRDITGDQREEVMLTSMGDQLMQIAQPDGTYASAPFSIGTYAHRPYFGDDGRPSTGCMRNLGIWTMTGGLICSSPKAMWIKCRPMRSKDPQ